MEYGMIKVLPQLARYYRGTSRRSSRNYCVGSRLYGANAQRVGGGLDAQHYEIANKGAEFALICNLSDSVALLQA